MSLGYSYGLAPRGQLQGVLVGVLVEAAENGLLKVAQLFAPLVSHSVKLLPFGKKLPLLLPGAVYLNLQGRDQV